MKNIIKIADEILTKEEAESPKGKPTIFLGGSCEDNDWREQLIKEFKEFSFLDPFDKDWEAKDNIYDECFALLNADYVVFYKGGELTEKEKELLEKSNKDYKVFNNLDNLKKHLKTIKTASLISNEIFNTSILSVAQLLRLKPLIEKKALNLLDIMSETSRRSIKYEPGCTATMSRATPKANRWIFSVKCSERWSKGPYDVRFRVLKAQTKDPMTREIEVSCNCNAWQYNGADYNALKKDYSERQYSNGEAPTIRDPRRKYLICKHVAACIPIFSGFIMPKS